LTEEDVREAVGAMRPGTLAVLIPAQDVMDALDALDAIEAPDPRQSVRATPSGG
jgi:hypothetical protein